PKRLDIQQKSAKLYYDKVKLFSINLVISTCIIDKMAESNVIEENELRNVRDKQNDGQPPGIFVKSDDKPFQCSECDFISSKEAEAQSHKLSHSVESAIPSSKNDACGSGNGVTPNATLSHKLEQNYTCSKCGYQCTSYKDLSFHMLCHTGEEPFVCSLCDFKCTNLGSVKVHMLEHTDKRPITCSICENAHQITQGGHAISLPDKSLRIVSVNVNLMPAGPLAFLTSGKAEERAAQLADFIFKNHGNNTDIFYIEELYHVDASLAFISKMEEAGFQCFTGPKAGTYDEKYYKYNSGQAIFINKNKIEFDLHKCNEENILSTNMANIDDKNIASVDRLSTQTPKYTVTHLESLAFPSHGIHGKGALEKDVPKGAIWLRLKVNNINENSEIEEQILDTYYLHLQSDPLALLFNFTPQQVRREQIETLREYSVTNTENIKMPCHSLFIGDFNIDAQWDEFMSLKELLNVIPVSEEKHVTIGSPTNTSHYPWVWKIGGILYDHYEAQLDHCLVSSSLKQLKSSSATKSPLAFGTFPLCIIKENRDGGGTPTEEKCSLTDHEGIYVEVNF
ncbi:unnamed protein product, partial [Meganyctiphanes norvegica]